MVANKNQQRAIDVCINALNFWKSSNDINSPSHYTIIDEFMFDLEEDILDGENPEVIGKQLIGLLNIIRHIE